MQFIPTFINFYTDVNYPELKLIINNIRVNYALGGNGTLNPRPRAHKTRALTN